MIIPQNLEKFIEIEPETGITVFFVVHHELPSPYRLSLNPNTRYTGYLCAYVVIPLGKSVEEDQEMEFKCPIDITFGYVECWPTGENNDEYDMYYSIGDSKGGYVPAWRNVHIPDGYRVVGWAFDYIIHDEYTVEQAVNDSFDAARYLAKNRIRRSD